MQKNRKNKVKQTAAQREAAIASTIRKFNEEKKRREEELQKELQQELKRIEEEEEMQKIKNREDEKLKQQLKEKQKLKMEQNKQISKQQHTDSQIKSSIQKYGYTPSILSSSYPVNHPHMIEKKNVNDDTQINNLLEKGLPKQKGVPQEGGLCEGSPINDEKEYRSPIICVLGHVDVGKTLLLDRIRSDYVKTIEAGNITQEIGVSFVSIENIKLKTKYVDAQFKNKLKYKVPGILILDTPGHESFENLRMRGMDVCDIIIVVVDIIVGLQSTTMNCIMELIQKNRKFIIVANKIDKLYGWKSQTNQTIKENIKSQDGFVRMEFETKINNIKTQLQQLGINGQLYYQNINDIPIMPTSAFSSEGLPDMLMMVIQLSQKWLPEQLKKQPNVDCTVLEVKYITGKGLVLEVILINGILKKGDIIIVNGIIKTHIKAIIVNNKLYDQICGTICCRIEAPNLENIVAGSQLLVENPGEDHLNGAVLGSPLHDLKKQLDKENGIFIYASSFGSLESLLIYLKSCGIPVSHVRIGEIQKKDISKIVIKKLQYPCMLVFNMNVNKEIAEYAQQMSVKLIEDDVMYGLTKKFNQYVEDIQKIKQKELEKLVIFPCILSILPNCIFNKKSPIVCGVTVLEGILKVGTPICIINQNKELLEIGSVNSIQKNHKNIQQAVAGDDVCVNIIQPEDKQQYMYSRHFTSDDLLYSKITRSSIDALISAYPEIVKQKNIYNLIKKLKKILNII